MIIRGKRELEETYSTLGPEDAFIGCLTGSGQHPLMLIDLLERGVKCYPSPLAQMLNGSKVAQAVVLNDFMFPHTVTISRRYDLMEAISTYNKHNIGAVITKADKMHCGHGIRKWKDIETLYSVIGHLNSEYPFVLQPFLDYFTDIRVIIIGDYIEAYTRKNPDNFRQNLSLGGKCFPCNITKEHMEFCRKVMERGKFPYGHIDIQVIDNGTCYLSEIALNGGVKGASIQRDMLDRKKKELLECLVSETILK